MNFRALTVSFMFTIVVQAAPAYSQWYIPSENETLALDAAQSRSAIASLCDEAKLVSRPTVLKVSPNVLDALQREYYQSLSTRLNLELSAISDPALQYVTRRSHDEVIAKWIEGNLSPEQQTSLDEARLRICVGTNGIFAFENEDALKIVGVKDSRRRSEIISKVRQVRTSLLRKYVDELCILQTEFLEELMTPSNLSLFREFLESKE